VQPRRSAQRGFSLTELLTVVGIIGLIAIVSVPAMMQLMPQYRIRSAASEAGAGLRMIRQKAITTRTPWRVSFDPANERYKYSRLRSPALDRSVANNWQNVYRDGRPAGTEQWIRGSAIDVRTATSNQFKDVDCDTYQDIIFLRDGSIATDPNGGGCGGGGALTFTTLPSVVFAVDNSFVRYNRYYLAFEKNGKLTVTPTKE